MGGATQGEVLDVLTPSSGAEDGVSPVLSAPVLCAAAYVALGSALDVGVVGTTTQGDPGNLEMVSAWPDEESGRRRWSERAVTLRGGTGLPSVLWTRIPGACGTAVPTGSLGREWRGV